MQVESSGGSAGGCERTPSALTKFVSKASLAEERHRASLFLFQVYLHQVLHDTVLHQHHVETHRRQPYTVLTNTQQCSGVRCPSRAPTNIPHGPPLKNSESDAVLSPKNTDWLTLSDLSTTPEITRQLGCINVHNIYD